MIIKTDINQFIKFHEYLTKDHPEYTPFYFPLNQNSKDPFEGISWKQNRATFEQACKYLGMGYNIGIAATDKDKLVIMDKDNLEAVGLTKATLTTTSRKRIGEHSFYFTEDKLPSSIFDNSAKQNIATEEAGEIRANWQYVVCAGSYVPVTDEELAIISDIDKPNAGRYTVREAITVNSITFDELPEIYRACLTEKREIELKKKLTDTKKITQKEKTGTKSALFDLSIEDVTGKTEDGTKRFASLFHGSDTGKNTSIKDGFLHCWRHNVSHTPLTALAVLSGIGQCSSVGFGHNGSGSSGLDLSTGETQYKLWEYAKREGFIPLDDPIPSKALVWFAVKNKICEETAIIDGWKLPTNIYNDTLVSLSDAKINPGRREIKNKTYNQTDMGNAQRLVDKFGKVIRYCHPVGAWYIWNGKYWEKDETAEIFRRAKETVKKIYHDAIEIEDPEKRKSAMSFAMKCESQSKLKSMIESAMSEPGIPILPETFDTNKMILNVKNGTVDLTTGKITPHERTNYITKISPVLYDPAAKCPLWLDFLNTVFAGRSDLINYMQLQAGYYLTGETKEEDFSIYYGTGGNGKTKYINQVMHVLGDYALKVNVKTIIDAKSQENGNSASGDVARLNGARLIVASEPEFGAELKEGLIKDLTGREKITARKLYQEEISFDPTFKIVLVTNHRVNIKSQDEGIWRRVKETPFTVKISDIKKPDPDLDVKLKKESSGILNWMIEGCLKWQKEGLQVPNDIIEATQDYKEDMDVLGEFITLCCTKNRKGIVPNRWLYSKIYLAYCEIMGIRPLSQKSFSGSLRDRGIHIKHTRLGNACEGLELSLHLSQFLSQQETDTANGVVTDGKDVTRFLRNFLCFQPHKDFIENTSHPSQSFTNNNNNKEVDSENRSMSNSVKGDVGVKGDFVTTKIILEKKFEMSEVDPIQKNKTQDIITIPQQKTTNLTELLNSAKMRFEHENGSVNNANIVSFCVWLCENYKPQWKSENEIVPYTPSAIKGIASKIFGLTPSLKLCEFCGNHLEGSKANQDGHHIVCERRKNNVLAYLEEFEPQVAEGVGVDEYLMRGAGFKWDNASDVEIKQIIDRLVQNKILAVTRSEHGKRFLVRIDRGIST